MELFAVTSGSYDDYSVNAIFLSRSEAEAYILENVAERPMHGYDHIEEWETSVASTDKKPFKVKIKRNGDIEQIQEVNFEDITGVGKQPNGWNVPAISWTFTVAARDQQHAIKIANEYRTQQIAAEAAWKAHKNA